MKKLFASILCVALTLTMSPVNLLGAGRQNVGQIAGTAVVEGKPLNNITVRLRNVDNGSLVGEVRTDQLGQFNFNGLQVGNYVVETVGPNGILLGTSTKIALVSGALVATGVTVSTSAAAAAAVGVGGAAGAAGGGAAGVGVGGAGTAGVGAAGAAAGAAAAGGAFLATTAGIVTAVAVGAGVTAAVVAVRNDASASGG